MKTQLTKEQNKHLIDLGVPKEKASDKFSYGFLGYDPIFTLTDLLEILPKEIINRCDLQISWNSLANEWFVGYEYSQSCHAVELINSLYELCEWTIENGYLKF